MCTNTLLCCVVLCFVVLCCVVLPREYLEIMYQSVSFRWLYYTGDTEVAAHKGKLGRKPAIWLGLSTLFLVPGGGRFGSLHGGETSV